MINKDVFIQQIDTHICFYYLGESYQYRYGFEKDIHESIELYRKVIELKNSTAMNNLASFIKIEKMGLKKIFTK